MDAWVWPAMWGGAGPAGSAYGEGCSIMTLLPAIEFFRVFLSHHVESVCNGSILKGNERKADAWLVVMTVPCGKNGSTQAFTESPQTWRIGVTGEKRRVPQRGNTRSKVKG